MGKGRAEGKGEDMLVEYAFVQKFRLKDGRLAFHMAELDDSSWTQVKDLEVL